MRKIAVLAAMLAVLAMASQGAEAGNRGVGFRHISPHVGAKLHGFKLHRSGVFGKTRHRQVGEAQALQAAALQSLRP
jgi:hypothetical protein